MTKRVFRSIVFSFITALVLSLLCFTGVALHYFSALLSDELAREVEYAAIGAEHAGVDYLKSLSTDRRITWISPDGSVIYDSAGSTANHADRDEVKQALADGKGSSIRQSDIINARCLYSAIRLEDGSILRLACEEDVFFALLRANISYFIVIIMLALVLSVAAAVLMSKNMLEPINSLDLEHLDNADCYPELSPLITKLRRQNAFIARRIAELRRRQEEFSVITENMSEGIIIVDGRGELLSYNAGASRIFVGLGESPTLTQDNSSAVLNDVVATTLAGNHNERAIELNGSVYHIIANPVYHDDEVTGAGIIILDVTEKENREIMRREFTSNVSHELKTPLTSIRGAAEIMLGGLVKPEDTQSFAQMIFDETSRLIALVEDILRLSQLDDGTNVPEYAEVDLYAAAGEVIERLKTIAGRRGITLSLEGEPAMIDAVPSLIDEMIFNLCDNAVKYNRDGGSVTVTVTGGEHPAVTVADTGIGIPKESQSRVFERFFRVDKSRSRAIGGTGLGLSIVKHAAAYHNAQVELQSEAGAGTAITVRF